MRLSKRLSHLLRHGALDAGLGDCMTPEGFVPLRRVLAIPRFGGVTVEEVRALVAADAKGRFEMRTTSTAASDGDGNPSALLIRACQGHTMGGVLDDDAMLTRLTVDDDRVREAVHGTSMKAWTLIRERGLSRMRRRHVHLATGLPGHGSVMSGMRGEDRTSRRAPDIPSPIASSQRRARSRRAFHPHEVMVSAR